MPLSSDTSSTQPPDIKLVDDAKLSIEKPPPGGLERFKSKRGPNIASVETLLTALPVQKIGEAGDFVRLHPRLLRQRADHRSET